MNQALALMILFFAFGLIWLAIECVHYFKMQRKLNKQLRDNPRTIIKEYEETFSES